MSNFLVLNDGTSKVLLNDGSSRVLLNGEVAGFTLSGTHAAQSLAEPKKSKLVNVFFTFQLLAGPFRGFFIKIYNLEKYLSPKGIATDEVRELFKLDKSRVYKGITKLIKQHNLMDLVELASSDDPDDQNLLLWHYMGSFEEKLKKLGEKLARK